MLYKQEQWKKWEPLKNLNGINNARFYISTIDKTDDNFKCIMITKQKDKKLELDFGSFVIAYQYIYEGFRLKTLGWCLEKDPITTKPEESIAHQSLNHDFFISENSNFFESIKNDFDKTDNLIHYVILDDNFCLDIIATKSPEVHLIHQAKEINE